jgi:RHS repeat-associated protein
VQSIADDRWGRCNYVYDPADRLLQVVRESGGTERYAYDQVGNMTLSEIPGEPPAGRNLTYGQGNRLLRAGDTAYEYDREGRRVTRIENCDSDSPRVWSYRWDGFGRLRTVTNPNGQAWHYKYDGLFRRIAKCGPNTGQRYMWDRGVLVHEQSDDATPSSWIYRPNSVAPLAVVQESQFYSVISDHLGTPRELIDSFGRVAWASTYTAWGDANPGRKTTVTADCPMRFLGQWRDDDSELHYNRFRYYDPTVGAFISQDPLGLGGGTNLYCYAKNPIRWSDPLGLCPSPDIDPKDVAGKTPAEIEALALSKGLIPKGKDPKAGLGSYIDPVTGEQRVLIHPDDPTSGPHAHVNDPSGQRLDIGGNPVDKDTAAAHLPLKTS